MKELTSTEFTATTTQKTILVDFGAEWCAPCKTILPVLERFSNEYAGKLEVYSVDIDRCPDIAAKYGVMSVPTLLLFKGGKPVERIVGVVSDRDLKKKMDPHLGGAA